MAPPALMKFNNAVALGAQSAKGTASTTGKAALHYVDFTKLINKEEVNPGPALGMGHGDQRSFNVGFEIPITASGIYTLSSLTSHVLGPMGSLASNTTLASGAKQYVFDAAQISTQVKYFTAWLLYNSYWNGSAFTTPSFKRAIRDCIMTSLSYTLANKAAPTWNTGFTGVNEGPGSVSDAFSMDTGYHMMNPAGAAALTLTAGDLIPNFGNFTGQSLKFEPMFNTQKSGGFNTGEAMIQSVVKGGKITLTTLYDITYAKFVEEYVHYLTQTPASSGTSNVITGYLSTELDYISQSQDLIPDDTDDLHFSLEANFDEVQWLEASHNLSEEQVSFTLVGKAVGTKFTHTLTTDKTLGQMTL